jgi:glycine cleavage system regulatory protein
MNMNASLVMTIIGPDRPGLVQSLAAVVAQHEGNWVESRMSHLAGHFAGILRIEIDAVRTDPLVDSLRQLESQGLELTVHSDTVVSAPAPRTVWLDLVGQDHPGIVSRVTKTIAEEGFNVEELSTECASAPMSGETLFRARVKLQVPAGDRDKVQRLSAALERTASDVMVDITLAEESLSEWAASRE